MSVDELHKAVLSGRKLEEDTRLLNELTQAAKEAFNPEMLQNMRDKIKTPRSQYGCTCANLKIKVPNVSSEPNCIDPVAFCYWLQGYVELHGSIPNEMQWDLIKQHLQLVFNKQTTYPSHLSDIFNDINKSSNIVC